MKELTAKQQHFLALLIEGMAPSEAYRGAFDCDNMSARAIATEAWRLRSRPDIAHMLREARQEVAKHAKWSRQQAVERLRVVNDSAFAEVAEGSADRDTQRLFMDSTSALNELCDVGFELELRRDAIRHEVDALNPLSFSFSPSWSRVRQVLEDADKTEVADDEKQDDA